MLKIFHNQKKNGYTMIEILVVMSIIAFITVASWYYIDYSRKLARDTKRVADLSQIQKALETFRNENGRYPNATDGVSTSGECVGDQYSRDNNGDGYADDKIEVTPCGTTSLRKKFELVMKDFIGAIPADPKHNCNTDDCDAANYFYSYDPNHSCTSGLYTTLCFSKSETQNSKFISKCGGTGGDMKQSQADYCILLK